MSAWASEFPILIFINGSFHVYFYVKDKSLSILSALSHNFRIVALSMESKSVTKRLCNYFSSTMSNNKGFTFDAVYVLKRQLAGGKLNVSHILLDHAEEIAEGELEKFAASKVIILTADAKIDDNF